MRNAALLLLGLIVATPTRAEPADQAGAERKLQAALTCYGKLELECFSARLREALVLAREQHAKPELVGRILLYLGVHHAVLNRSDAAARAFREALRRDPLLELDPQQFKPTLVALFRQVKAKLRGTLQVIADTKGARVLVDGERIGVTPLQTSLPIGRHALHVSGPRGGAAHTQEIVIRFDRTHRVQARVGPRPASHAAARPRPAPATSPRRIWTWIAAGGAAVTLAAAIGLGASADADHTDWEDELERGRAGAGDIQTWEALGQNVETKATAANVLFAASGALAVTAVVLFFLERRGAERGPRTTLGPGPGALRGLSLTRWF